jgi:hypothetical protein
VHSACELTEAIGEISQSDSMTGASIDALHHGEVSQ